MEAHGTVEVALAAVDELRTLLRQAAGGVPVFNPSDGLHMYYTSGTTGKPKGVVLSHAVVTLHALGTIHGQRTLFQ
jgi:acyl-coenzyme A synthetase/AMP-(fatty) acid ligase